MLVFENKEEIDIRGITTFGTSSKNNSQAIGFFGTGLKYAIAVLLRNKLTIAIYSGSKKYTFSTALVKIRLDEFEVVQMTDENDKSVVELAFTTQLGKTWELWQAYRELYCNTIDEKGTVELVNKAPRGKQGTTRIVVEGLDEIYASSGEFILRTKPLYSLNRIDLHPIENGKGAIFYRGIRVFEPKAKMLYSYNLKDKQELTEDRTLKYPYKADIDILYSIISSEIAKPVQDIITAPRDYFEGNLDYSWIEGTEPNEIFLGIMGTQTAATTSQSLYGFYSSYALANLDHLPRIPLSNDQKTILLEAKKLISPLGFQDIYSLVVTNLLGDAELCKANNNTIYLNKAIFELGILEISALIYQQYMHLSFANDANFTIIKDFIKAQNGKYFEDQTPDPGLEKQMDIEDFIKGREVA